LEKEWQISQMSDLTGKDFNHAHSYKGKILPVKKR
jgi:hypothetical protein